MSRVLDGFRPLILIASILCTLLLAASASAQNPCEVPDNGSGTVTLPPAGCDYLSPTEVHMIIDGLPPGTTIELAPIHKDFICSERVGPFCSVSLPPGECEVPGGGLGGNADCFDSILEVQATGTGDLAGFSRTLQIPLLTEVHTGPRNPGDPVQTFDNEMVRLEGAIFGDPDFDQLVFTAGSANGLPSPGQTTLTQLPSGNFNVDSFFDITYQIDFVGAPGSALDGMSGSTTATVRMETGEPVIPPNPCVVPDDGSGTVTLPPAGCEYLSPAEVHEIIDGLPAGTTIELAAIHKNFICDGQRPFCSAALPAGTCEAPGGGLGGSLDCFDSTAELIVTGTGDLAGYQRTLQVPLGVEVHSAARAPGAPLQDFDTEMVSLQGELFGDPDFCTFRFTGGSAHGLPSPGHTTITRLSSGDWNVDSFFDITYQIEFQGCPGSPLEGFGALTQPMQIAMTAGEPVPHPCTVPDNGTGTVTLPPAGCEYLSPTEVHMIIDGLPPGTTIEFDPIHHNFFCGGQRPFCSVALPPGTCESTGGALGGNLDCFDSEAQFQVTGTGDLSGFSRQIIVPLEVEVHTAPRTAGDPVQDFDTEMVQLQGELFGDPDFCTLRVRGGSANGLPSPGHTTLTDLGDGNFTVDSFFDITYEIEFQGCPGSVLDGFAGTTQASIPMLTPEPGSLVGLLAGAAGLVALAWRRRQRG